MEPRAEAVLPFECAFDCGFQGSYVQCEEHEETCRVQIAEKQPVVILQFDHKHTLPAAMIRDQIATIHAEAFAAAAQICWLCRGTPCSLLPPRATKNMKSTCLATFCCASIRWQFASSSLRCFGPLEAP